MSKLIDKIKRNIPVPAIVLFVLAFISGIIHVICLISVKFADFYNQYPGAFVRGALAKITGILPFSLAETIVLSIPVFIFIFIMIARRFFKRGNTDANRCIWGLVSVVALMYSLFVLGYGMGYNGSPLSEKLGLEEKAVSKEELVDTINWLNEETEDCLDGIVYSDSGRSYMEYSLGELNDKLLDAYDKACDKYTFIQRIRTVVKPVALSNLMAYTHISGLYSYYTGEANILTVFPDYSLPYTMAHELAHQRGIAPENEANFVAFLVCLESDDPYIKYSGCVSVLEYLFNALYSADSELYYETVTKVDLRIRKEISAFSSFFDKYRDSTASKIADTVNDTYLKLQGQKAGTKSYGLVVDLAVAYYKSISNAG